jgi:hypothetical protein
MPIGPRQIRSANLAKRTCDRRRPLRQGRTADPRCADSHRPRGVVRRDGFSQQRWSVQHPFAARRSVCEASPSRTKPADRGIWASQLTSSRPDNAPGDTAAALRPLRRRDRKAGQNGDARYRLHGLRAGHPFASLWAACGYRANSVRGGHKTANSILGQIGPAIGRH